MACTYVKGGAGGGVEKVIDHTGVCWFDNLASSATTRLKRAGWSKLDFIQKYDGVTEGSGACTGQH